MYEIDVTTHDLVKHTERSGGDAEAVLRRYNEDGTAKHAGKSKLWYDWMGRGKCPDCGVTPEFKQIEIKEEKDEPKQRKTTRAAKSNPGHDGHRGRKATSRSPGRNSRKSN